MTRAHYRNSRPGQQVGIAPYIENERRIINLLQPHRVDRIVQRENRDTLIRGASQLFPRQFSRFPGCNRLGRSSLYARPFQFGERGTKYGFGRSEMLDQFASSCGT